MSYERNRKFAQFKGISEVGSIYFEHRGKSFRTGVLEERKE